MTAGTKIRQFGLWDSPISPISMARSGGLGGTSLGFWTRRQRLIRLAGGAR